MRRIWSMAAVLTALALAGCAGTPPKPAARPEVAAKPDKPASRPGGYYQDDGPGDNPPANLATIPDAEPRVEPLHRFANDPYVVFGRTYTPDLSGRPYRAQGVASWYGRKFHGQRTASGEVYDMYGMTAAHPTLPIPSYVRVTNPKNGRSVIVRVNDRGPFHAERLIDLSYTAAYKLDLVAAGSGLVEVERIEPLAWAQSRPAVPPAETTAASDIADYWVQFGAFSVQANAQQLLERLQSQLGSLGESVRIVAKDGLFRLRAGPFKSSGEANDLVAEVRRLTEIQPVVLR